MTAFRFIPPSEPIEREAPPSGPGWSHEVKFDGFRVQLHVSDGKAAVFSRNGKDFGGRFRSVRTRLADLPVRSAVIDAELVAHDAAGKPDFRALIGGQKQDLVCWCFDLLEVDGRDLRALPLVTRRARLKALLKAAGDPMLRPSETFKDGEKLLAACAANGLEGIVSKKADQPYKSGRNHGWVKVKTHAWRAANANRGELFGKRSNG